MCRVVSPVKLRRGCIQSRGGAGQLGLLLHTSPCTFAQAFPRPSMPPALFILSPQPSELLFSL